MGLFDFFSSSARLNRQKNKLIRPEFAHLFDPIDDEWVCLDLEMTGLNPKSDHILSVGAVKITRHATPNHNTANQHSQAHSILSRSTLSIDTAHALSIVCRPPVMPATDTIIVHGLRPIDVAQGQDYETMLNTLLNFIGGRTIVGFCVDMDLAFLNALVKPYLGVNLPNPSLDVSVMEQKIRQAKNKNPELILEQKHLNSLLSEYKIPRLPSHDALNDAMMTAMLFCHLYQPKQS